MFGFLRRGLVLLIVLAAIYLGLVYGASESGEVVRLMAQINKESKSPRDFGWPTMSVLCGFAPIRVLAGISGSSGTIRRIQQS